MDETGQLNKGGVGLGLTICKRIVEQLGGTIQYDSTYTQGAKFDFTLTYKKLIRRTI
jgi:signal transduction histidine kinase